MKKLLGAFTLVLLGSITMNAQNLGVRLGGGYGSDAEISFQTSSSAASRLEIDLGFNFSDNNSRIGGAVVWQWVMPIEGNWNWYYGVGAALGIREDEGNDSFGAGVAGQIGIEYNFASAPFQISVDYRPAFFVVPATDFAGSAALGLRYRF